MTWLAFRAGAADYDVAAGAIIGTGLGTGVAICCIVTGKKARVSKMPGAMRGRGGGLLEWKLCFDRPWISAY